MDRRKIIKELGLSAGAFWIGKPLSVSASNREIARPVLTLAHITDVHISKDNDAPERFRKCLQWIIEKHKPDFFLNGGDAIMDASYDNVVREQVIAQWNIWDDCMRLIRPYETFACIGNHDIWWKAPSTQDSMYGKEYAAKRLNMPERYYSFTRKGWHFIALDGNNKDISLDEAQFHWLENDLATLPVGTPTLVMSHYPILGTTQVLVGGGHSDCKALKDLFYKYRDKVRICLSGHNHLSDNTIYNDVRYCCNGAMSGYWWGKGDKESAGEGYYLETPPGYAILKLYKDGKVENEYIQHHF
ncbi:MULTISPECIES: metallophosphoesterase family protein [Chitinophagaceae]